MAETRLNKNAELLIKGEIDERSPVITGGIRYYFPLDGRQGTLGFDALRRYLKGPSTNQDTGVNLADLFEWYNPANWGTLGSFTGGVANTYWSEEYQGINFKSTTNRSLIYRVIIDYNKTYKFSCRFLEDNDETSSSGVLQYMGGKRWDINFLATTNNYDYSIKAGWNPVLGVWYDVAKTWTAGETVRYIAGWKDQDSGSELMTKYWQPGGLQNYRGTANTSSYWVDMKLWNSTEDTSNVTFDPNDVAWMEESTTNVARQTYWGPWNNSGTSSNSQDDPAVDRLWDDVPVKSVTKLTDGSTGLRFGGVSPSVQSTVYSQSVWVWIDVMPTETGTFPYFREVYPAATGGASRGSLRYYDGNGNSFASWKTCPQRQWIKLTIDNITTKPDSSWFSISCYFTKAGSKVYFTGMQAEKKAFSTSFANTVRGEGARIRYEQDDPAWMDEFTYVMDVQFSGETSSGLNRFFDEDNLPGNNHIVLQWSEDTNEWQWRDAVDGHINISDSNFEYRKWYRVVAAGSKAGNTRSLHIEGVGSVTGSWSNSYDAGAVHDIILGGYWTDLNYFTGNCAIKNFAWYTVPLTDAQISSTLGTKKQITNVADLRVQEVEEMEGWIHVFSGPIYTFSSGNSTPRANETDFLLPGADLSSRDFNQMLIKSQIFEREANDYYIATTSRTARLKEDWFYYVDKLTVAPDTSGRTMLFHGADDGVEDVAYSPTAFGLCYGNSWRYWAGNAYYVGRGTGMYLGKYEAQLGVVLADWGASYADNYATIGEMQNDILIESGKGLTPRESTLVDVFIRYNPLVDYEDRMKYDTYQIQNIIIEDNTL